MRVSEYKITERGRNHICVALVHAPVRRWIATLPQAALWIESGVAQSINYWSSREGQIRQMLESILGRDT